MFEEKVAIIILLSGVSSKILSKTPPTVFSLIVKPGRAAFVESLKRRRTPSFPSEGNDADWYPGDQYVDIVGRDVYNKETADCVSEYTSIAENYGNKIVSLSECGTVGLISEQWASGARWSWFMPWYDGTNEDGSPVVHADEAWWKDAMSQEFVVSREDLPSME